MLLDDSVEDMDENCPDPGDKKPDYDLEFGRGAFSCSYDCLKDLDPVAASRIHPNDHRKLNQYLNLYTRSGMLPSKLLQGKTMENWGRVDNFRYNCCLICVDASLPVLDQYVERRVDCMVAAGLLKEVYHIYNLNADYTRGIRQAIGVREFEDFLREYLSERPNGREKDFVNETDVWISTTMGDDTCTDSKTAILSSSNESRLKLLLTEAINKVKLNTRRLVRRQKGGLIDRKLTLGGTYIMLMQQNPYYIGSLGFSEDTWTADVVGHSVEILRSYFNEDRSLLPDSDPRNLIQRDLWTQYMCKVGDYVQWIYLFCVYVYVTCLFLHITVLSCQVVYIGLDVGLPLNCFNGRPVGIGFSEGHTSGNNISKAAAIGKEHLGLESLVSFAMKNSTISKCN
ncbi:hypothetical protein RJ639_034917, partial [Escallonia herrerae]